MKLFSRTADGTPEPATDPEAAAAEFGTANAMTRPEVAQAARRVQEAQSKASAARRWAGTLEIRAATVEREAEAASRWADPAPPERTHWWGDPPTEQERQRAADALAQRLDELAEAEQHLEEERDKGSIWYPLEPARAGGASHIARRHMKLDDDHEYEAGEPVDVSGLDFDKVRQLERIRWLMEVR